MVDFLWGDNYVDTEDTSTKDDFKIEFRNALSNPSDDTFYKKILAVQYALEDDDEEMDEFSSVLKQVIGEVLDEDLSEWLKKSPGWSNFIKRRRTSKTTKTGTKEVDGKEVDVFETKDVQVENEANKKYIENKKLKDLMKPEVIRRLKGLNYLRSQEENLEKKLSEEEIDKIVRSPKFDYELVLEESTRGGEPTGKINTGTSVLTDKNLKDKAHLIIDYPNQLGSDRPLTDELEDISKKRASVLSNMSGNIVKPVAKNQSFDLLEDTLERYDLSLDEDFIEELNDELSKRTIQTKVFEMGKLGQMAGEREKVSESEKNRRIKEMFDKYSKEYDGAEKQAKSENKKVSDVFDGFIEQEEDETMWISKKNNSITISNEDYDKLSNKEKDKYKRKLIERKLTYEEYETAVGIPATTIAYPVDGFIAAAFEEVAQGKNKAKLNYKYNNFNKKWEEVDEPIEYTIKGGESTPISMSYENDDQIETLVKKITEMVKKEAKDSDLLKEYNRVMGIRVYVTFKVKKGKTKELYSSMKDAFEQGITDEDADVYEVSEGWKTKEGWKNGEGVRITNREYDKLSSEEKEEYQRIEVKQITDKEYDKLSPKKKQEYERVYRETQAEDIARIKREGAKEVLDAKTGEDITSEFGKITYKTGQVPIDEINESFKDTNISIKGYLMQAYEIPSVQLRPRRNRELNRTIGGYRKVIRKIKRLIGGLE
jgi:hypothetical protein